MKKAFLLLAVTSLLLVGAPLTSSARAGDPADAAGVVAPKGLGPCAPDDPVAALEVRVATSMGGTFLRCFASDKQIDLPGTTGLAPVPREYAFAMRLAGDGYAVADLDKLMATVARQWKDFQPLSKDHAAYIARLNAFAKAAGDPPATIATIKPVLVSIDRLDAKSSLVVSIRTFVLNVKDRQVTTTKVEGAAVVLAGHKLVRLTMLRVLTDPSDVAQLRTGIADWARAVEGADR